MKFFTSPDDLKSWVISQGKYEVAANKLLDAVGDKSQQDIVDTCKTIFDEKDDNAANVLFNVLAGYNLTQIREGKMTGKLKKQAQQMRQDSLYGQMPLRVCPKLPNSVGKRLISTYNCRHYCLDSIVLDDNPLKVYCGEALWRRHVMDKFSREWKDKDGNWVGGYINERFQVYHDDGGNNMQLANGERTKKQRPHQYSTERRLEEARGEKTEDITANSKNIIKIASVSTEKLDDTEQIFSDVIEMKESGIKYEDILTKVSEHYGKNIADVAIIYRVAMKQINRHSNVLYAYNNKKVVVAVDMLPEKSTLVTKREAVVVSADNNQEVVVRIETPVVKITNGNNPLFQIVDGPDAGKRFKLKNAAEMNEIFGIVDDMKEGTIQEAADEVGLNGVPAQDDFPIEEIK